MKRTTFALAVLVLVLAACAPTPPAPTAEVVIITPTVRVVVATAVPPTETPIPPTQPPTATRPPTEAPVALETIHEALRQNGYKRFPFTLSNGTTGYNWVKGNGYERIITWDNQSMRLEVVHDDSPDVRDSHMEMKFELLDQVFSGDFMSELRLKHGTYNNLVGPKVSGSPSYFVPADPSDPWHFQIGEYNAQEAVIRGVPVRFALWWWQVTCPAAASSCGLKDFPGTSFTGDASLIFYTIMIYL